MPGELTPLSQPLGTLLSSESPKSIRTVGFCPGTCLLRLMRRRCTGDPHECSCHGGKQLILHPVGHGHSAKGCDLELHSIGNIKSVLEETDPAVSEPEGIRDGAELSRDLVP